MDLKGNAALVTGGASGLGEATVRKMVAAGARVTIVDLNEERADALVSELGDAVSFVKTDVTDPQQVQAAVDHAGEQGPLRAAVICAGIGMAARTVGKDGSPLDLDKYSRIININLIGTFNCLSRAAAKIGTTEPYDEQGSRGAIVMTASAAAFDGQIGQIAYSASKGGVVGMTLPAARDLAALGIRVNTIAPGLFETPLMMGASDYLLKGLGSNLVHPKRLGDAAEYADLACLMVTNDYFNGETVRLDGAIRMPPK